MYITHKFRSQQVREAQMYLVFQSGSNLSDEYGYNVFIVPEKKNWGPEVEMSNHLMS